jgi:hypothetical protein
MKHKTPAIPSDVPDAVADILKRCFVTSPEERIGAAELLELLESAGDVAGAPAAAGKTFCFSYASQGDARMEEARAGLEARGHRVFYGKDVPATADADWRKQWCIECIAAQVCVNFLSDAYVRSDACAEEWNFAKASKAASSVVNLLVGGRGARQQLLAVPVEEVADKGGMAIHMHFKAGGQAVSVNGDDDIVEKILGQLAPRPARAAVAAPAPEPAAGSGGLSHPAPHPVPLAGAQCRAKCRT